jgi:hypothetical protein
MVGFLQTPGEHGHFLGGLLVAARLGHDDAVAIGLQCCGVLPAVGERLAEQFPGRGVLRVARDRFAQVRDGLIEISGLQVFVAERKAQQGAVARRAQQFLEVGDERRIDGCCSVTSRVFSSAAWIPRPR